MLILIYFIYLLKLYFEITSKIEEDNYSCNRLSQALNLYEVH